MANLEYLRDISTTLGQVCDLIGEAERALYRLESIGHITQVANRQRLREIRIAVTGELLVTDDAIEKEEAL